MSAVQRPAADAQRLRQRRGALRTDGQLDQADGLTWRVLDRHVLDVHVGSSGIGEQAAELTGTIVDDDRHDHERGRPLAVLPGQRPAALDPTSQQLGDGGIAGDIAGGNAAQCHDDLGHLGRDRFENLRRGGRIGDQDLGPQRGSALAMRVVSSRPGPASASIAGSAPARPAASALATTCGLCDTRATARSCSSAVITTGVARHRRTSSRARSRASADDADEGVNTQGRPANRSARGTGPGTFPSRHRMSSDVAGEIQPRATTSAYGETFTLATSVTEQANPESRTVAADDPTLDGGTASTARSADSTVVGGPGAQSGRELCGGAVAIEQVHDHPGFA